MATARLAANGKLATANSYLSFADVNRSFNRFSLQLTTTLMGSRVATAENG